MLYPGVSAAKLPAFFIINSAKIAMILYKDVIIVKLHAGPLGKHRVNKVLRRHKTSKQIKTLPVLAQIPQIIPYIAITNLIHLLKFSTFFELVVVDDLRLLGKKVMRVRQIHISFPVQKAQKKTYSGGKNSTKNFYNCSISQWIKFKFPSLRRGV